MSSGLPGSWLAPRRHPQYPQGRLLHGVEASLDDLVVICCLMAFVLTNKSDSNAVPFCRLCLAFSAIAVQQTQTFSVVLFRLTKP